MKKFINLPENYVDEMIDGIMCAHPNELEYINSDRRCIVKKHLSPNKVAIITGGGSGHLPLFLGYVGDGMLDGCAVGDVFQSPSFEQIYEITKHVNTGKGVLYLYGNYTGDILNFDMAAELADMDNIKTATVIAADDVASAPKSERDKRRGVAGIFYQYKVAGAKADEGAELEEVVRVAQKAGSRVATMGVALSPCVIPVVGKPSFTLADDEMEIGMGIHGEPGIRRGKLRPVDEIVEEMLVPIMQDLEIEAGDQVSLLVNGLGATCKDELYIAVRKISQILSDRQVNIYNSYVGEFATSMEMAGFSITLFKLDEELRTLLAKGANTPFFCQYPLK